MAPGRNEYLLLLGSNHRRAAGLRLAMRRLSERFDVLACSGARRTRDGDGPHYLNAALRVEAPIELGFDDLRSALRLIEAQAGRVRGGARCALDIDVMAKCHDGAMIEIYKPDDLHRDYVRPLLRAVGIDDLK